MNTENEKCVLIINENLPTGIIANIAAILGITVGSKRQDIIGEDITDRDGNKHLGIIRFPVPVLKADGTILNAMRGRLFSNEFSDVTAVDFSDIAQECKTYDEFIEKMKNCDEKDIKYLGVAVCGNKKAINKLTGNLPLLR